MVRQAWIFVVGVALAGAAGYYLVQWVVGEPNELPPVRQAATQPERRSRAHEARPPSEFGWRQLEPGLDLGVFKAVAESNIGDGRIRVLRIDPTYYELRTFGVSLSNTSQDLPATARDWCRREGLLAAINALPLQFDTPAAPRTRGTTARPRPTYPTALACNLLDPKNKKVPAMQVVDLDPFTRKQYRTFIAGARMVQGPTRSVKAPRNVWPDDDTRRCSVAAVGMDGSRVYFIFARSPYTVREFGTMLMQMKIGVRGVLLVAAGADAQLYVQAGGKEGEFFGSYDSAGRRDDSNGRPAAVANVVGIVKRANVEAPRPPEESGAAAGPDEDSGTDEPVPTKPAGTAKPDTAKSTTKSGGTGSGTAAGSKTTAAKSTTAKPPVKKGP